MLQIIDSEKLVEILQQQLRMEQTIKIPNSSEHLNLNTMSPKSLDQ